MIQDDPRDDLRAALLGTTAKRKVLGNLPLPTAAEVGAMPRPPLDHVHACCTGCGTRTVMHRARLASTVVVDDRFPAVAVDRCVACSDSGWENARSLTPAPS